MQSHLVEWLMFIFLEQGKGDSKIKAVPHCQGHKHRKRLKTPWEDISKDRRLLHTESPSDDGACCAGGCKMPWVIITVIELCKWTEYNWFVILSLPICLDGNIINTRIRIWWKEQFNKHNSVCYLNFKDKLHVFTGWIILTSNWHWGQWFSCFVHYYILCIRLLQEVQNICWLNEIFCT